MLLIIYFDFLSYFKFFSSLGLRCFINMDHIFSRTNKFPIEFHWKPIRVRVIHGIS